MTPSQSRLITSTPQDILLLELGESSSTNIYKTKIAVWVYYLKEQM